MKITVNRALMELKSLEDRICKKIDNTVFIAEVKKSSDTINGIYTRTSFISNVENQYQSIKDLLKNRNEIKSKVVLSNSQTKIKIADKEYTVAEAIDRKNNIQLEKSLLRAMQEQYSFVVSNVNRKNERVEDTLNDLLKQTFSSDKKVQPDLINTISENYTKEHGWEVVNPLQLQDEIETLRCDIESFEKEVDICLSESNAITIIEIED